jgi:hypothetical protein
MDYLSEKKDTDENQQKKGKSEFYIFGYHLKFSTISKKSLTKIKSVYTTVQ